MVGPELTAIITRLGPWLGTLIIVTNHRWESRSYRTWGSLVPRPLRTELKNPSVLALRPPWVPLLSKTLMRPLIVTRIWAGPTSPMLSGGMKKASESWAPRKLVPIVCGLYGGAATTAVLAIGHRGTASAEGFSRKGCRRRYSIAGLLGRGRAATFGASRSRAMISATVSVTPGSPVHGIPW